MRLLSILWGILRNHMKLSQKCSNGGPKEGTHLPIISCPLQSRLIMSRISCPVLLVCVCVGARTRVGPAKSQLKPAQNWLPPRGFAVLDMKCPVYLRLEFRASPPPKLIPPTPSFHCLPFWHKPFTWAPVTLPCELPFHRFLSGARVVQDTPRSVCLRSWAFSMPQFLFPYNDRLDQPRATNSDGGRGLISES